MGDFVFLCILEFFLLRVQWCFYPSTIAIQFEHLDVFVGEWMGVVAVKKRPQNESRSKFEIDTSEGTNNNSNEYIGDKVVSIQVVLALSTVHNGSTCSFHHPTQPEHSLNLINNLHTVTWFGWGAIATDFTFVSLALLYTMSFFLHSNRHNNKLLVFV